MSVKGKTSSDWEVRTLCDFNEPGRREVIRSHFSMMAAVKAFARINKIYGKFGRCWQEDREGRIVGGETQ